MTELIIEGKLAALKKGTSFDYIVENRLFTDADAFSLSIELPLKDCPQNRAIYGYITRRDVSANMTPKNAVLRCGTWQKSGVVTIVETTETSVKVQFLEGQSAANCSSPLNNYYINEINLPYPDTATATEAMCLKLAQADIDSQTSQEYLALPWLNEHSGVIQNKLSATEIAQTAVPASRYYPYEATKLSYQIYLLPLVKKILTAVNYTYNLSVWEQHSTWKYLMVFNALPAVWELKNFNRPLPHWTIIELLTQIENLLGVTFIIDDANSHVTMKTVSQYLTQTTRLTNVVDEHKVNVEENSIEYIGNKSTTYADCDYNEWRALSCQEELDGDLLECIVDTYTYEQIWTNAPREINEVYFPNDVFQKQDNRIYKASDTGEYFVRRNKVNQYTLNGIYVFNITMTGMLMKINTFGNVKSDNNFELKIVPARIDDLTKNENVNLYFLNTSLHMVVLNCGEINEEQAGTGPSGWHTEEELKALCSRPEKMLFGEEEQLTEFFDKLYVGFWKKSFAQLIPQNGSSDAMSGNYNQVPVLDHYACPVDGWMSYWRSEVRQARQDTGMTLSRKEIESAYTKVKQTRKLTVQWLSDDIPEVTNIFVIDNKKYLCERIKTQFSENGRSQLLEGEFWELA